jgi:hypothetical protein
VLLANFNYIDDVGRVAWGYAGWENFSRYTSNFLAGIVHTSYDYLGDISPFAQVVACFEMGLASCVVLYLLTGTTRFTVWMYVSAVPMALSPYFLECLSYKFDSPYMALSVLASVAPLLLRRRGGLPYFLAVVAGELVVCTTYQAATGVLPMLVILLALKDWLGGAPAKDAVRPAVFSAVAWAAGVVVFRLFIMQEVDTYVSNGLPPLLELPGVVAGNYSKYLSYVGSDFRTIWKVLLACIAASFLAAAASGTGRNRLAAAVVAAAALALMAALCFGLYPALSSPLYEPRAMYGFGVLVGLACMYVCSRAGLLLGKLAVAALCWCFFAFALVYGNALSVQDEWTDFRAAQVLGALDGIPEFAGDSAKTVQMSGKIDLAPAIQNELDTYPLLSRLVPILLGDGWVWGVSGIQNYYGASQHGVTFSYEQDWSPDDEGFSLVSEGMYQDVYGDGESHYIVVLK